ncbi:NAD(P)-dependent oxidoreductase [Spongiimicrobium salis]|uniref:NAD(P)-dependent oxidoreductase n=1 Tax=Spongiimicrobium salis TaxID=1667022 RepID=UPI00374D621E
MKNIGFIGMGIMGVRMASNLQKGGHKLIVHNRTKDKATSLLEQGALWAKTPKAVALESDLIITMLSTPEVVRQLALGKNGFLTAMKKGGLWINCSTVNPSFAEEMGRIAAEKGIRYMDAPVAGTKAPAEKGELLFLVGAAKEDLDHIHPLLDLMGQKTVYLGAIGQGSNMKMLINSLLAQSMMAFSEAMVLGQGMGIAENVLFDVLLKTPVVAPFLQLVRSKMEANDLEANFPLQWMHKDLHLAATTAYEKGIATPSLNNTKELYALAMQQGYIETDFSGIYAFLKSKK